MLLADLGADVVRVVTQEPNPLVPLLPAEVCWGRGKREVFASDDEVRELASRSDVVLVGATPEETELRGLTSQEMQRFAPETVHVWMPPFAERGEWCNLPDDPLLLAALTGLAVSLPADDLSPVAPVVPTLSSIHGALGACAAVAGLIGRKRFGTAPHSVVTGLDAGSALMGPSFTEINGKPSFAPTRAKTPAPNWRPYACADGKFIFLAALTAQLFFRALEVLECDSVMDLPSVAGDFTSILDLRRGRAEVTNILESIFSTRTSDDWLARFRQSRVPSQLVQTRQEWMDGPVVADGNTRLELDHSILGQVTMPNLAIEFSETPGYVRGFSVWTDLQSIGWRTESSSSDGSTSNVLPLPLKGIQVLDISSFFAGPFASAILADFGADVVRVEPPEGDGYRAYPLSFMAVNQRKTGLTLDLALPSSASILKAMLPKVDVLVENLRPPVREKLNLVETSSSYPQLVHCSVSAFGRAEKWADVQGFDPILQSLSGMASAQGGDDGPICSSAGVNDSGTGALSALGILSAIYCRERTSRGQRVWSSLASASTFLQAAEFTTWNGSPETQRGRQLFRGPTEGHRYYECSDGWIATGAADETSLALFHTAIEWKDSGVAELVLRGMSVSEATRHLAHFGVSACRVVPRNLPLHDPFLEANSFSHLVSVPNGVARVVNRFSRWRNAEEPRASQYFDIGEHSVSILHDFEIEMTMEAELVQSDDRRGAII
jgi:crotonobetainyl-CoA:carnitine CoA-transferase CaiB-like acyl-CoA transferase